MIQTTKDRSDYVYRCSVCGFENRKKIIPGSRSSVPLTGKGNYGDNATPTPVAFADEMYKAVTIGFVAATDSAPAYLTDSACLFGEKHFTPYMKIRIVTDSGTNDGDYTIAERGVSRNEILLSSTDDLTTENAAAAGKAIISRILYKPNITSGCPNCGSLASR